MTGTPHIFVWSWVGDLSDHLGQWEGPRIASPTYFRSFEPVLQSLKTCEAVARKKSRKRSYVFFAVFFAGFGSVEDGDGFLRCFKISPSKRTVVDGIKSKVIQSPIYSKADQGSWLFLVRHVSATSTFLTWRVIFFLVGRMMRNQVMFGVPNSMKEGFI